MLLVRPTRLLERDSRDHVWPPRARTPPHPRVHRCPDPPHPGQFSPRQSHFQHILSHVSCPGNTRPRLTIHFQVSALLSLYSSLCPKPLADFPFLSMLKSELRKAGLTGRLRWGAFSAFQGQNECRLLSVPRDLTHRCSSRPPYFQPAPSISSAEHAAWATLCWPSPSAPTTYRCLTEALFSNLLTWLVLVIVQMADPPRLSCNQAAAGGRGSGLAPARENQAYRMY